LVRPPPFRGESSSASQALSKPLKPPGCPLYAMGGAGITRDGGGQGKVGPSSPLTLLCYVTPTLKPGNERLAGTHLSSMGCGWRDGIQASMWPPTQDAAARGEGGRGYLCDVLPCRTLARNRKGTCLPGKQAWARTPKARPRCFLLAQSPGKASCRSQQAGRPRAQGPLEADAMPVPSLRGGVSGYPLLKAADLSCVEAVGPCVTRCRAT
jgi:hypothetical protein